MYIRVLHGDVPITNNVIAGMAELVKERPPNPIEWLASYLLKHDPQRAGAVGMPGQGMGGGHVGQSMQP